MQEVETARRQRDGLVSRRRNVQTRGRRYSAQWCADCAIDVYLYQHPDSHNRYNWHQFDSSLTQWATTHGKTMTTYDVRKFYHAKFQEFEGQKDEEAAARSVGWNDKLSQDANFAAVVAHTEDVGGRFSGLKLHDAGCGNGHFLTYLKTVGKAPVTYFGTDLLPLYTMAARKAHQDDSNAVFLNLDLMVQDFPKTDLTVCIGALAFHKPRAVEALLARLWDNTGSVLTFTTWWNLTPNYVYFEHIAALQKVISRFVKKKEHRVVEGEAYGQPTDRLYVVYR